jgi:hypothetical protein
MRSLGRAAALGALCFVAVVYGPQVGHGFIKDDFVWIETSRIERPSELNRLLDTGTGFFRPVVTASFALNEALFELAPRGYGATNLLLLFACIGALFALLRALGYSAAVATAGAIVWALNFHGVNMAVLWISGRTALWVTVFACASAWAWERRRRRWSIAFAVCAMWSKEEAFVLPALLTAWTVVDRRSVRTTWPLWVAAGFSLAVRTLSGAYTPQNAPPFYRYQLELATLVQNAFQYADRSLTTTIAALVIFWLFAGRPRVAAPDSPHPEHPEHRDLIVKGLLWLVIAFAPTIMLPVRSSLYALLPSVGAIVAAAALLERMVRGAGPRAVRRATMAMLVLLVMLFPIYRARNLRYVREAELSAAVMREVVAVAAAAEEGAVVVINDARDARPTAEQSFGALADRAAQLFTGGRIHMVIDPPTAELPSGPPLERQPLAAVLAVAGGEVRRVR